MKRNYTFKVNFTIECEGETFEDTAIQSITDIRNFLTIEFPKNITISDYGYVETDNPNISEELKELDILNDKFEIELM